MATKKTEEPGADTAPKKANHGENLHRLASSVESGNNSPALVAEMRSIADAVGGKKGKAGDADDSTEGE